MTIGIISEKSHNRGHHHSKRMPGVKWILAAIYLWHAVMLRDLLFNWGIPAPLQLISSIGSLFVVCLLAIGVCVYIRRARLCSHFSVWRRNEIYAWFTLLLLYSAYGIAHGNDWPSVGKELIAGCYFVFFLILGSDDRFWYEIEKPLTILFYMSVLLVVTYSHTPAIQLTVDSITQENAASIATGGRLIGSLGYEFRPLIESGLFLGMWGLVRRHGRFWRTLQVSAWLAMFACNVGLFLFRGWVLMLALVVLSYVILRPLLEREPFPFKNVLVLAASAILVVGFMRTSQSTFLAKRFTQETRSEGIFHSRDAELQAYFNDLGWESLIGRGMGGSFDKTGAMTDMKVSERLGLDLSKWKTLHYGIFILLLKGGILMLVIFSSWLISGFSVRRPVWYKNSCNLTAALLFPAFAFNVVFNPFTFSVEGLLSMLSLMIVLSRFIKRLPPRTVAISGVLVTPTRQVLESVFQIHDSSNARIS